ncbi:hypothetical protein PoB_000431500 [Plakobranchus ocellatus]|uniref:Uncharacterized protein n=1 Tax=Plakobranchus ocellatus TaxID=259542 RepID=A0AAV3Y444_9GAST|nr:hypothetical protein PoB_000431500 [Plakobranchus ocellatus]
MRCISDVENLTKIIVGFVPLTPVSKPREDAQSPHPPCLLRSDLLPTGDELSGDMDRGGTRTAGGRE